MAGDPNTTLEHVGNRLWANEQAALPDVGEVEIDRTKFGIKYGSGSFFDDLGDRAIYDNFKIKFKIAASM